MALRISGDGNITGINSLNTDVSSTELGYLDGVSSGIQSQINNASSYGYFAYNAGVTINAGTGVTIPFNTTYISNGITLSSNSFTFSKTGAYMFDLGFRPGSAADVWTIIDLYNATTGIVGKSFGFGTINPDVGARTAHFMAEISNISVAYTLRVTRSSGMTLSEPNETQPDPDYPETIPSIGLTIWKVG